MGISSIIVEDSKIARLTLEKMCVQHESVENEATFESAESALVFLETKKVDLIWLDVEMDKMTGFDFLNNLDYMPMVIMVTSNKSYAYDAFQYNILDFIEKPISLPRFNLAMEKVLMNWKRQPSVKENDKEIFIKVNKKYVRIKKDDILYIENVGDYVNVKTENESFIAYLTLKYLEDKLGDHFYRVRRSFIVNLTKIIDVEETNLVIGKKVIPISRRLKTDFLKRLNIV
jgi:DNA-binding LytR/AlgR family response regulator